MPSKYHYFINSLMEQNNINNNFILSLHRSIPHLHWNIDRYRHATKETYRVVAFWAASSCWVVNQVVDVEEHLVVVLCWTERCYCVRNVCKLTIEELLLIIKDQTLPIIKLNSCGFINFCTYMESVLYAFYYSRHLLLFIIARFNAYRMITFWKFA